MERSVCEARWKSVTCASKSPGGASGPNGAPSARPAGRITSERVAVGVSSSQDRSNRRPTTAENAAPGSLVDDDAANDAVEVDEDEAADEDDDADAATDDVEDDDVAEDDAREVDDAGIFTTTRKPSERESSCESFCDISRLMLHE